MMRTIVVLFCLSVCACTQAPSRATGGASGETSMRAAALNPDTLEAVVTRAAQRYYDDAPQAVGLSVGVVAGDQIQTYHFGTLAPGGDAPPTDGTLYAIGSITKTLTGVLIARAARDGRLGLDDDIRQYLDGPYPNLAYDGHPVRVAHLINHVSGLPNTLPDRPEMYPNHEAYGGDMAAWMAHVSAALETYTPADFFRDLRAVRLDTMPGTRFAYSNAGAQLAGRILERVYGRPYAALVDTFVAGPLRMPDTRIALDADQAARLAKGYDAQGNAMPPVPAAYGAAGGLKSTVVDLARYARWHLDERDPVVRRSHTPPGGEAGDPERGYGVGLNWQLLRSSDGVRRVWQDGNVAGYSARVVLYPALGVGVVVLANELDPATPEQTDKLADTILEAMDTRTFSFWEAM